jgi:hypothetical protein
MSKGCRDKSEDANGITDVVRVPDKTPAEIKPVPMTSPGLPRAPNTPDGKPPRSGDYVHGAANILARVAATPGDPLNPSDRRLAEAWLDQALEDLPPGRTEITVGSELIPCGDNGDARVLRNTVESPSYVTADASRSRLDLAFKAGALEIGLDLADTIQAGNSLEKMLAHQLAATHNSAMRMTAQMNECIERMTAYRPDERERANIQATRLAGAVARMNGSFQQGIATLQRMRSGGRQVVTVQHVQVNEGGQAVVAGQVKGGGGSRSARGKERK